MITEQIILDIIKNELDLCDEQCWIANQNRLIPADNRLYVVCGQVSSTPIAVTNTIVMNTDGINLDEIQQVQMREDIQIDIFSSSTESLYRRLEILAALSSIYSEQAQEINQFKIFDCSRNFTNSSAAEGGSNLNRFTATVSCFVSFRKQKPISFNAGKYYNGTYYDSYPGKVTNDANTNVITFNPVDTGI